MEQKIITNPVKAIRAKCIECCCGSYSEVEQCTITKCALYPFRMGKNPYRAERSPAQIAASKEALKRATGKRNAQETWAVAENETT